MFQAYLVEHLNSHGGARRVVKTVIRFSFFKLFSKPEVPKLLRTFESSYLEGLLPLN